MQLWIQRVAMAAWANYLLIACLVLAALLAIVDFVRRRSWRRFLVSMIILAIAAVVLGAMSYGSTRQSFGGTSPLIALALMFAGVLLGIAATYIFNLSGPFSWRDLARPLVVSPLVLLPLIGSLQGAALEPMQMVCFAVLAFQNGFFWQQVLKDAKPTV